MKRLMIVTAIAGLISTTPADASVRDAAFASTADRQLPQMSTFVGASYRLSLDGRTRGPRGRASLKLSGMTASPEKGDFRFGDGLELTAAQGHRPALSIAGRDGGQLGRRANLSTGATIGLVVLGVAVAGAAVVALLIDERLDRQNAE